MNISEFLQIFRKLKRNFQKRDFEESYERPLSFDHNRNKELNNPRIIDKAQKYTNLSYQEIFHLRWNIKISRISKRKNSTEMAKDYQEHIFSNKQTCIDV